MPIPLPQKMIDLLDLEPRDLTQNEYGFKGYYPVLETHLMWYSESTGEWKFAERIKVSKNLSGWYYFGSIPIDREAPMAQHLINLKRQIDDAIFYIKETKIKNKLKKINEDFK